MAVIFLSSVFLAGLFGGHATYASISSNSRLAYGNAPAYCAGADYVKGMIWLSNQSDYYSDMVKVGQNDTRVPLSLRGAANVCIGAYASWKVPVQVYATEVRSLHGGLSIYGSEFWRGQFTTGAEYEWTTQGGWLNGDLDVSGVAQCNPSDLSGKATGSINVAVWRGQRVVWANGAVRIGDPQIEYISINVERTCPVSNFNLEPSVSVTPSAGEYDTVVNVSAGVTNSGLTSSTPASWSIRRVIVTPTGSINGAATNNQTAQQYFGGDEIAASTQSFGVGSTPLSSSIPEQRLPDLPVGSRVCYTLSVAPYRHDNGQRRHSQPACVTIAKRPKVQVIGGDLYVGRTPQGVAPVSARILTSNTRNPSGLYGSWAEYGVAATGPITSMGSGAGYVGGANSSATLLTFTNQTTATSCGGSVGCYNFKNSTLPDPSRLFGVSATTPSFGSGSLSPLPSGMYKPSNSGTITITASAIALGQSVIINAPNNDVVITGNIAYSSGPMPSVAAIPQVIIMARNITISDSVTQVDAWLLSPGIVAADGSVTNGVIRTCQTPAASINAGVCATKLQVNGPVVAHRLIMLRTAGSGPGKEAGDPGEVFNLRPDAYLWALNHLQNNGRITSVETKELPPRY